MRTQIGARAVPSHSSALAEDRVSLTIRPACPLPELLLCHKKGFVAAHAEADRVATDSPGEVRDGIYSPKGANLPAVELSEKTLTQIAYFID
jgi:hypothetical protein